MGTFQITAPNGKKYRVTGDDPSGAMAALQKMIGADGQAPSPVKIDPATNQPAGVPAFDPHVPGYNPQTGNIEMSKVQSAASGAGDVASFGFGDELAAGLGATSEKLASYIDSSVKPRSYDDLLGTIRDQDMRAQRDNPKSYLAGQIGGGVAQGLATGGAGILPAAETTLGKVGLGALTGGTMGGIYGAGSGEGLADRGYEAVKNALIGIAAGGAFPAVAKGVSSAYSAVVDALAGKAAAKAAGSSPEVIRMLGNVMDADGTLGAQGQANMAKAGSEAMLADAGPNAKAILDTAIQRGGPGAVSARQAITDRAGRSAQAIAQALDTHLGAPEGVTAARTAIREGSAPARQSAYEAAYASPIDYSHQTGQTIEHIVKTRVPKSAIDAANELMRTEGAQSKQILAKVADDGSVVFERLPDVQQLDYITRGLNEVADQADGAGKLGGTTAKGRAYSNLASDLRSHLKSLVPEYGNALEVAGDPIRRSKAVEMGSKLLSSSTTRDQVSEAVQGMTQAEKDAVAQGVRSHLDDAMANVTRTLQDGDTGAREAVKALKDLSSRANREKLETVIGKAKAEALFADVDQAATSFDLRAAVNENSKTYARQATDQRVKDITAPGIIANTVSAPVQPLKAAQKVAAALVGQSPARVSAKQDAIYSQIADLLTRQQGQSGPAFSAVQRLGTTDAATKLMAERIARGLGGPHLAYPTTVLAGQQLPGR